MSAERTTRILDDRGRLGEETTHAASRLATLKTMDPPACPPVYDLHACPWLDLESPLTPYEALKLLVLSPLAMVRAVWMLVTWLIVGCMSWLICLGVPDDAPLPTLRYGASDASQSSRSRRRWVSSGADEPTRPLCPLNRSYPNPRKARTDAIVSPRKGRLSHGRAWSTLLKGEP